MDRRLTFSPFSAGSLKKFYRFIMIWKTWKFWKTQKKETRKKKKKTWKMEKWKTFDQKRSDTIEFTQGYTRYGRISISSKCLRWIRWKWTKRSDLGVGFLKRVNHFNAGWMDRLKMGKWSKTYRNNNKSMGQSDWKRIGLGNREEWTIFNLRGTDTGTKDGIDFKMVSEDGVGRR